MVEAHPVGVVQDPGALQAGDQGGSVREVEGGNADFACELARAMGRIGQGSNLASAREQSGRDVFAGIAEGAGNDA